MASPSRTSWLLILGGLGLTTAGIVLARRQYRGGLGRVVTRLSEPAPVVGETRGNGMVVQHRRSANMSIEQRVRSIQDMVWKGVQLPHMRKLALQITKGCPERDGECEAKAIYQYVKKNVRYTGDVAPVKMGADGPVEAIDLYTRADRTLEFGGGDCDDQSVVNATLLALNGIPARLKVTAESRTAEWGHIYTICGLDKLQPTRWLALDTTLPGSNHFGKEVPFGRSIEFPV